MLSQASTHRDTDTAVSDAETAALCAALDASLDLHSAQNECTDVEALIQETTGCTVCVVASS